MIARESNTKEWILSLRDQIVKRVDPKLIEKVIYALTLLEQLKLNNLDFVFKGGTALLLMTEVPRRFSIDIDIVTIEPESKILTTLDKIRDLEIFNRWEDDNKREHSHNTPVRHFKLYYKSVLDRSNEPILLDILCTCNPYLRTSEIPIEHKWLNTTGIATLVTVPLFESFLGDKLTAFAPKTTGILFSKNRPVEIIKQLYDIALLFDKVKDLDLVRESYTRVFQEQIAFRHLDLKISDVLADTWEACFFLAERNMKSLEFNQLLLGIKNFTNFTIEKFSIEEAITAASKVAYLISLLQYKDKQGIKRFRYPEEIREWQIKEQKYNKLNKLKKTNPEAFFYWHLSMQFVLME